MKKTIKKSFAVLLTLLTVVCIMPISSRAVTTDIPSDAVELNGHYYYAFDEGKTWTEAKEKCEAMGGHLVTISSAAEQKQVLEILKTKNAYWIGAAREKDSWHWIDDTPFSYTNWGVGEPNNQASVESYAEIIRCNYKHFSAGKWNDLENDPLDNRNELFYQKQNLGFVCEWEKKTVPTGYNFLRDSYGFGNYGADIDKKYFYLMFGMPAGFSMWAIKHNQERGLCFGMAYTAASLLNSMPAINNIRESFPSASSSIEIAYRKMTIEDYIKFAHIYQFDLECIAKTFFPTSAKEIYNQVKKNVENDSIGLTIRIARKNGKGAHQVLPVGINQNNILIYDSNNTTNLEYLTVNDDGTWYYSGSTDYNSTTCNLTIYSDYMRPYQKLLLLHLYDWYEAAKSVVSKNALLTVSNECNIGTTDIAEILAEANGENEQSTAKQYWLLSDKSVTVSSTSNGANEFSLAGSEFVVGASVNDKSEVTLTADEKNDVKIKSVEGNAYSVSFIGFGEKCEALKTEITGVANGSEVTAAKTENGVVVTGLNNLSIVYSEDDVEVGNATAEVKDGREVNVTVDKNDDTVKTDFVGEQTEDICGYCGKGHGTSFKEVLIKFVHRIFYFFVKLFGLKK